MYSKVCIPPIPLKFEFFNAPFVRENSLNEIYNEWPLRPPLGAVTPLKPFRVILPLLYGFVKVNYRNKNTPEEKSSGVLIFHSV